MFQNIVSPLILYLFLFVVIKCPEIFPTPFQSITCPSGTRYGSICNISCEEGSKVNGTDIVVCERRIHEHFGYWTWEDNRSFCQGMIISKIHSNLQFMSNLILTVSLSFFNQF